MANASEGRVTERRDQHPKDMVAAVIGCASRTGSGLKLTDCFLIGSPCLLFEVRRSNQVVSKTLTLPLVYSIAAQAISASEPSTMAAAWCWKQKRVAINLVGRWASLLLTLEIQY
ncbi:hypothetical protein KXX02_006631 [Aspergillus fumigatus]|nr:hypothetical protein KXX02_006631 [Aspergillus fumigatus]